MDPHLDPEAFFALPPAPLEGEWALAAGLPGLSMDCPHSAEAVLELWESGARVAVPLKVALLEEAGGFEMLADALPLLLSSPLALSFQTHEMYRAIGFDAARRLHGRARERDATRLDPFVEPCGRALSGQAARACLSMVEALCPDWAAGSARAAWEAPRGAERDILGGTEVASVDLTAARLVAWESATVADRAAMLVARRAASGRRRIQARALFEALGPTAVAARLMAPSFDMPESAESFWSRFAARREAHLLSLGAREGADSALGRAGPRL